MVVGAIRDIPDRVQGEGGGGGGRGRGGGGDSDRGKRGRLMGWDNGIE